MNQQIEAKGLNAIAAVLRIGSISSTVVMAFGTVLALIKGGAPTASRIFSPGELILKVWVLDPRAVTQFGIFLLLLTPVVRIAAAVMTFGLERDGKYVLISASVFLIVLGSIVFAMS